MTVLANLKLDSPHFMNSNVHEAPQGAQPARTRCSSYSICYLIAENSRTSGDSVLVFADVRTIQQFQILSAEDVKLAK